MDIREPRWDRVLSLLEPGIERRFVALRIEVHCFEVSASLWELISFKGPLSAQMTSRGMVEELNSQVMGLCTVLLKFPLERNGVVPMS
jgi:hypothetical protein